VTNRRRAATAAALLLATSSIALSGCPTYGPPYACASWVQFDDAQSMYEEAVLVVEAVVGETNGVVPYSTGPGESHGAAVEQVHKGEFETDELTVSAPRDYCTAGPPDPATDPLVEGERVLLFLRPFGEVDPGLPVAGVEHWTVLTPWDGILPFPEGTELPFAAD
jgi:hypothetical protein